ncbi:MAG TPA: toxin-antitoxin system HicB family antitoxin [Thermoanaerobaculia bacterium]|jgi:hypothetical protein
MSTLSVKIPDPLYRHAEDLARREGVTMDEFIVRAVERLAEHYMEERARRASRAKYDAALAQVRDVEPEEYDRLRT